MADARDEQRLPLLVQDDLLRAALRPITAKHGAEILGAYHQHAPGHKIRVDKYVSTLWVHV